MKYYVKLKKFFCIIASIILLAFVFSSCENANKVENLNNGEELFYQTSNTVFVFKNEEIDLPFYSKNVKANYIIENEEIVLINNNKIKGLKVGKTTITAKYLDKELKVLVEVADKNINAVLFYSLNSDFANFFGRDDADENGVNFYYGTSGFEVKFYGTKLTAKLKNINLNSSYTPQIQVLVDGELVPLDDSLARKIVVSSKEYEDYTLIDNLSESFHTVKVLKRTAYLRGETLMDAFSVSSVETDGYILSKPEINKLNVEVYGDSISCGFKNINGTNVTSDNTNSLLTYHYIASELLNANVNVQAHSGWGVCVYQDGTIKNSTMWCNAYDKLRAFNNTIWDFSYNPDIVIINLGTEDELGILTGTYNSSNFVNNYKQMVIGIMFKCTNAKFIFSYGMLGTNQIIWQDILSVKQSLEKDFGSNKFYSFNFSDYRESNNLTINSHTQNGEELAFFIQKYVL